MYTFRRKKEKTLHFSPPGRRDCAVDATGLVGSSLTGSGHWKSRHQTVFTPVFWPRTTNVRYKKTTSNVICWQTAHRNIVRDVCRHIPVSSTPCNVKLRCYVEQPVVVWGEEQVCNANLPGVSVAVVALLRCPPRQSPSVVKRLILSMYCVVNSASPARTFTMLCWEVDVWKRRCFPWRMSERRHFFLVCRL